MANCYAAGRGVEKDEKKARVYYEAGALVGDISSKCKTKNLPNLRAKTYSKT